MASSCCHSEEVWGPSGWRYGLIIVMALVPAEVFGLCWRSFESGVDTVAQAIRFFRVRQECRATAFLGTPNNLRNPCRPDCFAGIGPAHHTTSAFPALPPAHNDPQ